MKRVKLTVSYDGTNYCGWQVQPNGITVEEVINRELTKLLKEDIRVIGASRTDSGVHALGNIAVFDTETRIPAEKIAYALNRSLPDDIVVQSSMQVEPDFHPRYCDSRKTYEYHIWSAPFPLPTNRRYTYHFYHPLDIEAMKKASTFLVGEHDFLSFCSVGAQVLTTIRTIYSIEVLQSKSILPACNNEGMLSCIKKISLTDALSAEDSMKETSYKQIEEDSIKETGYKQTEVQTENESKGGRLQNSEIIIRICGNGFLYNMVRIITGTLLQVGSGIKSPEWVKEVLDAKDRSLAGPTAPAQGLTLIHIEYNKLK